jgi:hypothetical protein
MVAWTNTLIIGAGPYGLSLAAHLRANGANFRIVGRIMAPWRTAMTDGMLLKSEGFASTLFDPKSEFTLGTYCAQQGIPYADTGEPVRVETFVAYGEAFQRRMVPNLEERLVENLRQVPDGFEATCDDGTVIAAKRVVLASGIMNFVYIPRELRHLPQACISHSSDHHDLSRFNGQDVIVLGAGASAMDVAGAARLKGAKVRVVARRPSVRFQTPLGERSLLDKIRAPMTVVGPGWKSVLCTKLPSLFRVMPDKFRTMVVNRYLGPAPAWFSRQSVEGHIPIMTSTTVLGADTDNGRVRLSLRLKDGNTTEVAADHLIAATGFRVDINRIDFLDRRLVSAIRSVDGAPRLSRNFESSVPGLYFTGLASANSFGPMLRFAAGAGFAARRLSRHLSAPMARKPVDRAVHRPVDAVPAQGQG